MKIEDIHQVGALVCRLREAENDQQVLNDQAPSDHGLLLLPQSHVPAGSSTQIEVIYSSPAAGRAARLMISDPELITTIKALALGVVNDSIDSLKARLAELGVDT